MAITLDAAHTQGLALVHTHTRRFVDLVTSLDAAALAAPVPDTVWTAGEVVTHVESVFLRYTVAKERGASPEAVGTLNRSDVEELGVDVARSVATINEQLALLDAVTPAIPPDRTFPFHAGVEITMAGGWGNLLGELLAHGDDVARATGRTFTIPSADTEILWRFTAPVLTGWLRPEASSASDRWRLRFPFGDIDVVFAAGAVHWDAPGAGEPDHVIEVDDAAELALRFPYRRRPIEDAELATFADRFYDV